MLNNIKNAIAITSAFLCRILRFFALTIFYDEKSQSYVTNADTEKYDITVNGEAVDKEVRYTLNTYGRFELSRDLPKLQDDCISDGFYSPTTTVTKYTYTVFGIDKKTYSAAKFAFDWTVGGDTRIYFPGQSGFHA